MRSPSRSRAGIIIVIEKLVRLEIAKRLQEEQKNVDIDKIIVDWEEEMNEWI